MGAKISPAYVPLPRVAIEGYPDTNIKSMAAVPERMTVKIGDLVEVNTRYRDASLPCHFIPWVINRPVDANVAQQASRNNGIVRFAAQSVQFVSDRGIPPVEQRHVRST